MDIQNYCNDGVRRRDRLLDAGRAAELLRTGEYAVLSMVENRGGSVGSRLFISLRPRQQR